MLYIVAHADYDYNPKTAFVTQECRLDTGTTVSEFFKQIGLPVTGYHDQDCETLAKHFQQAVNYIELGESNIVSGWECFPYFEEHWEGDWPEDLFENEEPVRLDRKRERELGARFGLAFVLIVGGIGVLLSLWLLVNMLRTW